MTTLDTRQCPYCEGEIKIAARICKHCKQDVPEYNARQSQEPAESHKETQSSPLAATGQIVTSPGLESTCPECGSPNKEGSIFCADCGHKFGSNNACPECGNVLKPNAKFCGSCGKQLSESQPNNIVKVPIQTGRRGYSNDHSQSANVPRHPEDAYQDPDTLIFPTGQRKSVIGAFLLTFFLGGVGQLYLGQIGLGIILIIFDIIGWIGAPTGIGLIWLLAIGIAALVSVYKDTKAWNEGRPIKKWGYVWRGTAKLKKEFR
ncbi:MAG: zinc ribbon domain-containing protein [Proteobacteria bacterium]|nr:zinc ribbon domain-containing protein [Pseudomonadota bacterium]